MRKVKLKISILKHDKLQKSVFFCHLVILASYDIYLLNCDVNTMLGSLFLMIAPDWSLPGTHVCKELLVVGVAIAPGSNSLTTEVMNKEHEIVV